MNMTHLHGSMVGHIQCALWHAQRSQWSRAQEHLCDALHLARVLGLRHRIGHILSALRLVKRAGLHTDKELARLAANLP